MSSGKPLADHEVNYIRTFEFSRLFVIGFANGGSRVKVQMIKQIDEQ